VVSLAQPGVYTYSHKQLKCIVRKLFPAWRFEPARVKPNYPDQPDGRLTLTVSVFNQLDQYQQPWSQGLIRITHCFLSCTVR